MTVATKFDLELRCSVCDSVLCVNIESHCDKSGTWVYVDPCEKCAAQSRMQRTGSTVVHFVDTCDCDVCVAVRAEDPPANNA